MKVLSTQNFIEKFKSLSDTEKKKIAPLFESLSQMDKVSFNDFLKKSKEIVPSTSVFVIRLHDFRLFYTIVTKEQEEIVLFIDLVKRKFTNKVTINPVASKDPRVNPTLNPHFNYTINPNSNYLINPNSNYLINPYSNYLINPNSNYLINPNSNYLINPYSNYLINPLSNYTLNPKSNPYINPHNYSFSGQIVYDLSLNVKYFIVKASEEVILFYDVELNWRYFGVKAKGEDQKKVNKNKEEAHPVIYVVFDLNNRWVGYMVSNGSGGFNYFSLTNQWLYFVV